jgi:hypothetical protein
LTDAATRERLIIYDQSADRSAVHVTPVSGGEPILR